MIGSSNPNKGQFTTKTELSVDDIIDKLSELINNYAETKDDIHSLSNLYDDFSLLKFHIVKLTNDCYNTISLYSTKYSLSYNELYVKYQNDENGKRRTSAIIESLVKSELNHLKEKYKKSEDDLKVLQNFSYLCNDWQKAIYLKINLFTKNI